MDRSRAAAVAHCPSGIADKRHGCGCGHQPETQTSPEERDTVMTTDELMAEIDALKARMDQQEKSRRMGMWVVLGIMLLKTLFKTK